MIYFDNAATTPIDPKVVQVMSLFMKEHYGNPSSIHAKGRETRAAIEKARKTIANTLQVSPAEIFFTSGGTESNNTAIKSAIKDLEVTRIITSKLEHHCVMNAVEACKKYDNIDIQYIDVKEKGALDYDHLEQLLQETDKKTLVTVIHANNEIGNITDIKRVGELCKKNKAYFHTDTVQSYAHYPIDMNDIPVHFISGAGHKFHGPKGVGFLYINNEIKISPLIDGGGQERNMRSGTENVYGIIGLAKAAELAYDSLEKDKRYVEDLKMSFRDQLKRVIPNVQFNGFSGEENSLYTVLNVAFPTDLDASMFLFNLDIAGVCVSAGSACSSGADTGSHVINTIGDKLEGYASIRFSFSKYNTLEEVNTVVDKVANILTVNA